MRSLTIFFAGHGVETNSGYFLTCSDSIKRQLALTGLSLTDVFQLLNEGGGLHTNIVLDACEAGGVAVDVSAITKSFEVGVAGGSSVSILAMSSRNEAVDEASDGSGGYGTKALLNVMRGDVDTGKNAGELSLADIAQIIDISEGPQTSSFWSFNLQGTSVFCKNAFALKFRATEVYEPPAIFSTVRIELTQVHRDRLWQCFLDYKDTPDPREIYEAITATISDKLYLEAAPAIFLGLFDSFLHQSRKSKDAFAPVVLSSVFLMLASEKLQNRQLTNYFVKALSEELDRVLKELADDLEVDQLFLVRGAGGYSEFITLPQRITSLAAWALLATRLPVFAGTDPSGVSGTTARILASLSNDYMGSFDLVSEKQASAIAVISALGRGFDKNWSEQLIGCLYHSFFSHHGKVARVDLPADKMLPFLKHRLSSDKANFQEFCDRPSEALFVLFASFWSSSLLDTVRHDFAELDGTVLGTFIPQNYSSFSEEIIRDGTNIYFKIGFEVFTIVELLAFFENELKPRVAAASRDVTNVECVIAACAALVFQDRVPWQLNGWVLKNGA